VTYKPLPLKIFLQYIRALGWTLKKGGKDWNLYDEFGHFVCSVIIAHGKKTKEEVVAYSVHKVEKIVKKERGSWPPRKK
jgi:hypothetical protein